jgi:hypothetical protein
MAATWSFETIKAFPDISYEDLFPLFLEAVRGLGLEITLVDKASGRIEARKPGRWLMRSVQEIAVTVGTNSKVTFVEKVSMRSPIFSGKASTDDMLTRKLIAAVKETV